MKRVGFARHERVRLWLSYQRYAMLLSCVWVGMIAGQVALGRASAWGWAALLIVVPLSFNIAGFCVEVLRSHARKLRATWAHQRRIDSGRFAPTAVRSYCGDPCWRVVADEVLTRAGLPAAERRSLIRTYKAEFEADAHATVYVDHVTGTVRRSTANGETLTFLHHQPRASTPSFEPGPTS